MIFSEIPGVQTQFFRKTLRFEPLALSNRSTLSLSTLCACDVIPKVLDFGIPLHLMENV